METAHDVHLWHLYPTYLDRDRSNQCPQFWVLKNCEQHGTGLAGKPAVGTERREEEDN